MKKIPTNAALAINLALPAMEYLLLTVLPATPLISENSTIINVRAYLSIMTRGRKPVSLAITLAILV